jgi:hypothetical protein
MKLFETKEEREVRYFKECLALENLDNWEEYANDESIEWEVCGGRFIINATCCVPTIHAFGSYNDSGVIEYPQPELIEVNSIIDYEGEELEISQELEDLIIKTFGI